MGFSTDLFLMTPAPEDSNEEILAQLGFKKLKLNRTTQLNGKFSFKGSIVIGRHKDYLVIFAGVSDKYFRSVTPSDIEKQFCEKYNQHKILALSNYEVANSYLYNYIVNGNRVRTKCGADGMGIEYEYGTIIPLEDEPYDPITIEDGQRVYYKSYQYTNPKTGVLVEGQNRFLHDQVGGDTAFRLCTLITGKTYYENWEEGIEYSEYYVPEILDRLRMPYSKVTNSQSRFNFINRTRFGTEAFIHSLEKFVSPFLEEQGFEFDPTTIVYVRSKEGFQQVITFSSKSEIGKITFDSYPRIEIRTPHLKDWWLKELGTDIYEPGKPNRLVRENLSVSTPFHLDQRDMQIKGELGEMDYDKIAFVLCSYIKDTIVPFFDFNDTLKKVASVVHFDFLKVEFYFSLEATAEAEWLIKDFLKTINFPDYDERYQWMIDHYKPRVTKFLAKTLDQIHAAPFSESPIPSFEIPANQVILDFSGFAIKSTPDSPSNSTLPTIQQRSVSKTIPVQRNPSNWLQKLIVKLFGKS